MLRSELCDYSNAYIVVKETIIVKVTNPVNKRNKKLTFKNNPQFRSYILKTNNTFISNVKDLGIVMLMYSLLS